MKNNLALGLAAAVATAAVVSPVSSLAQYRTQSNSGIVGHAVQAATPDAVAGTVAWAVVNADGSLARGTSAASSSHISTGAYEVLFNFKTLKCAYTATIGNAGAGNPAHGTIVVAARAGNNRGVFIETDDTTNALADLPFHVLVTC